MEKMLTMLIAFHISAANQCFHHTHPKNPTSCHLLAPLGPVPGAIQILYISLVVPRTSAALWCASVASMQLQGVLLLGTRALLFQEYYLRALFLFSTLFGATFTIPLRWTNWHTGWFFFNWSARFSLPKWKNLLANEELFYIKNFVKK